MQKKSKERYYVTVHVMPYVERYMTDNYGIRDERVRNLVNINRDPFLQAVFLTRLEKRPLSNSPHGDESVESIAVARRRTAIINIEISQTAFERRGWKLSAKDEAAVALFLERRCQGMLLAFLQTDYLLTGDLAQSIRHFNRRFHQAEETWPTDSIRKLWLRNVPESQRKTLHGLLEREISKIMMAQLSRFGTISYQGLLRYSEDL